MSGDTLYFKNAEKGSYTLTVSDKNGKYADLSADFILYTEEMPAAFNEDTTTPGLFKNGDATDEEFADYLKNITSVTCKWKSICSKRKRSCCTVQGGWFLKDRCSTVRRGRFL